MIKTRKVKKYIEVDVEELKRDDSFLLDAIGGVFTGKYFVKHNADLLVKKEEREAYSIEYLHENKNKGFYNIIPTTTIYRLIEEEEIVRPKIKYEGKLIL